MRDQLFEHRVYLKLLSLQVFQNAALSFGRNNMNVYLASLPKSPASPNGLVVLLKAVAGKDNDVVAVLEI